MLLTYHVFHYNCVRPFEHGQLVGNLFQRWINLSTKRVVRKWPICKTWPIYMPPFLVNLQNTFSTGWRRCIGCLKLQTSFRKRATNHRALLRKMTYKDKASCGSSPPCSELTFENCELVHWCGVRVAFVHTYIHTHVPVHTHTHTHIHVHIYPPTQHTTRIHAHTHTQTHTHKICDLSNRCDTYVQFARPCSLKRFRVLGL